MKKIILEIPISDFEEIDSPVTWMTEFGEFDNINDIYAIESTIKYFKTSRDAPYLINAYQDLRKMVVKGLLERHSLQGSKLPDNYLLVEAIAHRIFQFRDGVGYKIEDYKFEWTTHCTGKKIGIPGTKQEYNNIDSLVSDAVSNFTNRFNRKSMYPYKIIDAE